MSCRYFVIELVRSPEALQGIPIGVVVVTYGAPGQAYAGCQFRKDWSTVRDLHPQADFEVIEALTQQITQRINAGDAPATVAHLVDSFSNTIRLLGPADCGAESGKECLIHLVRTFFGESVP